MVLTAVLRLGATDVRNVAVVGDTTSDLLAGSRAGAGLVVGVLTGAHDSARLATAPHTHLLASVRQLPALVGSHRR
jgi:phosphoglycolate phosphatase-like HAD superfamily hydrolase